MLEERGEEKDETFKFNHEVVKAFEVKIYHGNLAKQGNFRLRVIFAGLSLYNLGWSLEETCQRLKEQFGLEAVPSTLGEWVKEFEPLCRYARLRPFGLKAL